MNNRATNVIFVSNNSKSRVTCVRQEAQSQNLPYKLYLASMSRKHSILKSKFFKYDTTYRERALARSLRQTIELLIIISRNISSCSYRCLDEAHHVTKDVGRTTGPKRAARAQVKDTERLQQRLIIGGMTHRSCVPSPRCAKWMHLVL